MKTLAATYSRRGYTTTTIGNAAFDGRVRKGIGSDHSFMATKKFKERICSQKTAHKTSTNELPLKRKKSSHTFD